MKTSTAAGTTSSDGFNVADFAVDHDVNGRGLFELHVAHRAARSQRMLE